MVSKSHIKQNTNCQLTNEKAYAYSIIISHLRTFMEYSNNMDDQRQI